MNINELDFEEVLKRLRAWHQELEPRLRAPEDAQAHGQAVQLKRQIEAALCCLKFCQEHGLYPARLKNALVLPPTRCCGSDCQVMEDLESGNRNDWLDPMINGTSEPIHADEGDVLV